MNPQDLTRYYTEANQAENETEHLARLLFELRNLAHESNEAMSNSVATRTKEWEFIRSDNYRASKERQELINTAENIVTAIQEKDINLSGVIAALDEVRNEIVASRREDKEEEPVEAERHQNVLNAISGLIQATKENKPKSVDLSPVVDKTEETAKKTHELLSALLAEVSMIEIPEVKIPEFPKEIEVKEPKWYKPFSFDTKWLKPIEYAVNAINPKPALARLEELISKILKRPLPKVPLNRDGSRVLVEVDRTGGGGTGVTNTIGTPVNPATEETLAGEFAVKVTTSGTTTYVAKAAIGSSQSSAVWQAKKIDESSGVVITWADSGNFSQVATDLTALTYS